MRLAPDRRVAGATARYAPWVQAYDVELLRRLVLAELRAGGAGYPAALARLRSLAAYYGPPEIAALACRAELPQPPRQQPY